MNLADSRLGAAFPGFTHSLLRTITGLLFMQHGAQKLLGLLIDPSRAWGGPPPTFTLYWFAGVLELFGGALIALGLFTRPVAFLLCGEMAVAYFKAHAPSAFFPIRNRGEVVVLFCFVYLFMFAFGGGPYSLDAWWRRRKGEAAQAAPTLG